ncbi:Sir2 family NAD-dependent protein deacetylase [Parasegetibacter sp. NRK P23]|uniref:SIR2 family NAD-dependent protein deacylase n=1 Tax=Parasegetibacter sp. NRK P23 TaxID=2942999 RepID=UPI00204331FD|nr:Sir2 family NAD-dependent protein deacetylase [Parasegetibacter sp. NRK P23]MCM5528364.1 NAD-dependent deacylase [Parasegetibacter sp. NRK P23]
MSKKKLVVLSGAGISAESGLKTFRDSDGLWNGYDVTEVATPGAWKKNAALVLDFYNMRRKEVAAAQPNAAHKGLAALEKDFDVTIITQNIDDLHERGGSTNVLHLHGQIFEMRSEKDPSMIFPITGDMLPGATAPDGALLRPNIVWFEEEVPMIVPAANISADADIFVVVGTSLAVYPAAGLLQYPAMNTPKFILDKNIPFTGNMRNMTPIEGPASEGISTLTALLQSYK